MRNKIEYSDDLHKLKLKFDHWRGTRTKRNLSPGLWDQAVQIASKEGVCRVSRTLGLNFERLGTRVKEQKFLLATKLPKSIKERPSVSSRFIELTPASGLERSLPRKTVRVHILCGPGRQLEVNFESPEAKDWENLFSGLLRAEKLPQLEVTS